jgi:hypothetical protein
MESGNCDDHTPHDALRSMASVAALDVPGTLG